MKLAIGLMSGTSLDGVDAALLVSDGETIARFGDTFYRPYREEERALLRASMAIATVLTDRDSRPEPMSAAERVVTAAHAEAVRHLLARSGHRASEIDVTGFHGQTVRHAPERRLTIQLGDAWRLARETGIDVVYDFRAADMKAGGQGAPLVPAFHRALVASARIGLPAVFVNIGGVANVTWIGERGELVAFDCGPGNGIIDDLMRARVNAPLDKDGAMAARGKVDQEALAHLLEHPFFARRPPKSLDRNSFSRAALDGFPLADAAATLTAFSAESIARAQGYFPRPPRLWVISGGGARNPTLIAELRARVDGDVELASAFGWSEDFIEAQAFAYLAVRSLSDLPLTFPETTGVPEPTTGGKLAKKE